MKSIFKTIIGVFFLSMLTVQLSWSQTIETFNYSGAVQNYTVPAGVTSITVHAWGGGGGGVHRGSGGGGGAYETGILSVNGGDVISINVGKGGEGRDNTTGVTIAEDGGTTSVTGGATTISAQGGIKGTDYHAVGGSGGVGTYNGADGGQSPYPTISGARGGGAGGSAGNGIGQNGGIGTYPGGNGGATSGGNGQSGFVPGGGGSGSGNNANVAGDGAHGRVVLEVADPVVPVPTMGEWALMILALIIMSMGVVTVMKWQSVRDLQTAGGNAQLSMNTGSALPFNKKSYFQILPMVWLSLTAIFVVSVIGFGYEMTGADVPGALMAGAVGAYLIHLIKK